MIDETNMKQLTTVAGAKVVLRGHKLWYPNASMPLMPLPMNQACIAHYWFSFRSDIRIDKRNRNPPFPDSPPVFTANM